MRTLIETISAMYDVSRVSPKLKRSGRVVRDRIAAMVATQPDYAERLDRSFESMKNSIITFTLLYEYSLKDKP